MATFIKFHYIYVSFFVLFDVVPVSEKEKTASKNEINARLLHRYLHFKFAIFNSTRKDFFYCVEFTYDSRLKYELKAEHARRFRRLKQMTSSMATVVIWAIVFWESGLHAQWLTALPNREIWYNRWHKKQLVLQYGGQQGWLDNQLQWKSLALPYY